LADPSKKTGAGKGGCKQAAASQTGLSDDSGAAKEDNAGGRKKGDAAFKGRKGGKGNAAFQGKGGKGGKGRAPGGLTVDQIVERIMAFDKNKDGKITKDELPERMHNLIAKGDTNKDGALDKDEIKKLATVLAKERGFAALGGRGGFGGRGFGPGAGGRGRGFGGGGFGGTGTTGPQAALADLKLTGQTKQKAEAVLKANQENIRKLLDLARSDLLIKMKDVLSEQDYKKFKEALDRQPNRRGPGLVAAPAELQNRLDRLIKEAEDLRRLIQR
jgi:hypothetical protein